MTPLTCGMAVKCHKPGCRYCDLDYTPPPLEETDPVYASLVAATPYLDANWVLVRGGPLKPSERISFAYYVMSTNLYIGIARARREAAEWLSAVLDKARQRYRGGFYADPFGEPVRRPA